MRSSWLFWVVAMIAGGVEMTGVAFASECGATGSVTSRIADCERVNHARARYRHAMWAESLEDSIPALSDDPIVGLEGANPEADARHRVEWRLVTVTAGGAEVWLNPRTEELWFRVDQWIHNAWRTVAAANVTCARLSRPLRLGARGRSFTLPTSNQIDTAVSQGLREAFHLVTNDSSYLAAAPMTTGAGTGSTEVLYCRDQRCTPAQVLAESSEDGVMTHSFCVAPLAAR